MTIIHNSLTSFIEEMIGNQKIVKAFSRENATMDEFEEINNRLSKISLKAMSLCDQESQQRANCSTKVITQKTPITFCLSQI